MNNIIKIIEQEHIKPNLPSFRVGDLIEVMLWIVESNKKRLQAFEGLIIAIRNRGLNSSFTVRKSLHSNEGIERVFKIHSPMIDTFYVKRHGNVRRSKLYYLRHLTGRSARIKERVYKLTK